jgi:4-diphosphocytidyl-2-C-methyl-D-erythritol kinase
MMISWPQIYKHSNYILIIILLITDVGIEKMVYILYNKIKIQPIDWLEPKHWITCIMGGFMRQIKLKAPGKINWTLDVTGRREDGYHEVEMLMQSIGLWDEIILTESAEGISIRSTGGIPGMPLDESNIAVKAAKLVMDYCRVNTGLDISIHKELPVAAGLAGGSANAAAVLAGLNALWSLGLSREELEALAVKLGADVPFCIRGGTSIARGIGEKLTSLPALEGISLILIKLPFSVSTASVYGALTLDGIVKRPNWEKVYKGLSSADFSSLSRDMANVLEAVTATQYPEIKMVEQHLMEAGAEAAMMTGSGPTVFGVFKEHGTAWDASQRMKKLYDQVYLVKTLSRGVEIIEGGSHESN